MRNKGPLLNHFITSDGQYRSVSEECQYKMIYATNDFITTVETDYIFTVLTYQNITKIQYL